MSTNNGDRALDVIGKKIKLKEEIDQPFDENELKDLVLEIENSKEPQTQKTLALKVYSKDIGFNCLCELNLGKAYQLTKEGKRVRYPKSYKCAMNEKWLDYIIKQIENANNPVVVVSDIFTRVTTGNNEETLPYREQLAYAYNKLKTIKDKLILVRGLREKEIINNGGPDLMEKLANLLDMKNKLVDSGFHLTIKVNNQKNHQVSLLHFNQKLSSVRSLAISMQKFANNNPGHDVYFCTTSKTNWYSCGLTTYVDKTGKTQTKTCWYIAFGGMYEYDKTNEKRPELGTYTLNKDWSKITFGKNGTVRIDRVDYRYPHPTKIDSSNYIGSVVADKKINSFAQLFDSFSSALEKSNEKIIKSTSKEITSAIHQAKQSINNKKKNIEIIKTKTKSAKDENKDDVKLNGEQTLWWKD